LFLKKRWQRISLVVLAGAVLVSLIFLLLINSILEPIAERKLKNAVYTASDGIYRLNIGHFALHLFSGNAELEDISLIPDTQLFRKRQQTGQAPAELITLRIKEIRIIDAHPFRYLFKKQADIGSIRLKDPEGTLSQFREAKKSSAPAKTIYQKISDKIQRISVGQIGLEDIRLIYRDLSGSKPAITSLKELSLEATGLLIDSVTQHDSTRTLYCRDIIAEIKNFKGRTADGNYRYGLRSASYSTRRQRLQASGITIEPLPREAFFARTRGDRFSLDLHALTLEQFRFRDFQLGQKLVAGKIKLEGGQFDVSANPRGPVAATDRVITFPNYSLTHLGYAVLVDTLAITGIDISYHEINKRSGKTGMILFSKTTARFLHVGNDSSYLNRQDFAQLDLSSSFMDAGKLELNAVFNLKDPAYGYRISGHLGSMPLTVINPAVMPLALAEIKKGQFNSLDFNLTANRKSVHGKVQVLYSDLSVALLGSSPGEDYHTKPLKTLAAKVFVVKAANPDEPGKAPRTARVIFLRPASYPFFKTLWESLLSGIKPCAGMGDTQKQAVPAPMTKKEQRAKDKAVKKALKEKKKADKAFNKKLKKSQQQQGS
jgi:hypothetical protein